MPNLGTKYECFSCGALFYDLGKPEAICPKCNANQKDAKRSEAQGESAAVKRKRREEVAARVIDVPDDEPAVVADEEFHDDEIETPEGVEEEEVHLEDEAE